MGPGATRVKLAVACAKYGLTLVGVGTIWEILLYLKLADSKTLGTPIQLVVALGKILALGSNYTQFAGTVWAVIVAFILGTVGGIFCALLLGYIPVLGAACQPIISALNALPRVALAPLFVLWFGLGFRASVAVAVSMVVVFTLITVYAGLLAIPKEVITSAKVGGATGHQLFISVYLPGVAKWVITSLELNVGFSFVGVIVGQYLGAASGLGYLIESSSTAGNIPQMEGFLVVTMAIAAAFIVAIRAARKRWVRWE